MSKKVTLTKHVKNRLGGRLNMFGLTSGDVDSMVNATVSGRISQLRKDIQNWVLLAVLDKEVRFPANTPDGEVNGDSLVAVIRWSGTWKTYRVTTVLLRRNVPAPDGVIFWEAPTLRKIKQTDILIGGTHV